MTVLASFEPLLQPFAAAMIAPGFQNLTLPVAGWLFAPRRTVTGMLVAADLAGKRRHAAFHRCSRAPAGIPTRSAWRCPT